MRDLNELQHKDKSYFTISRLAARQVCLVANKCSVHTEDDCLAFHEIAKSTHTSEIHMLGTSTSRDCHAFLA